eukprot:1137225-Pelagomonas_calceolata.AAC.10
MFALAEFRTHTLHSPRDWLWRAGGNAGLLTLWADAGVLETTLRPPSMGTALQIPEDPCVPSAADYCISGTALHPEWRCVICSSDDRALHAEWHCVICSLDHKALYAEWHVQLGRHSTFHPESGVVSCAAWMTEPCLNQGCN